MNFLRTKKHYMKSAHLHFVWTVHLRFDYSETWIVWIYRYSSTKIYIDPTLRVVWIEFIIYE